MLCNSFLRSASCQAEFRKLSYNWRGLNAQQRLTYLWDFKSIITRKMMVDSGTNTKGGPVIHILPEKDDDGGYAGGGWKSEDGRLSCGYSSFRGKRATMEDFYDIKTSKVDGKTVCLFGIFDGHGGSRAAEYLKEHLFVNLMTHPEFITDTKLAISELIDVFDLCLLLLTHQVIWMTIESIIFGLHCTPSLLETTLKSSLVLLMGLTTCGCLDPTPVSYRKINIYNSTNQPNLWWGHFQELIFTLRRLWNAHPAYCCYSDD